MLKKIPIWLVAAVAFVVVGAAGYYFGIRPQREEASKLDSQIAELQIQIEAAKRLAAAPEEEDSGAAIRVADLVKLAKAMPDETDMAGIILELNAAATAAGVEFAAIQPGAAVPGNGYTQMSISLTFEGTYYELTQLLFSLRHLVTVRDGVLDADGRLFSIDGLELQEGTVGFPDVKALITVTAYQYGVDPAALVAGSVADTTAAQPAAGGETSTDTGATSTDTTSTTTTTPAPPTEPAPAPPAEVEAPQAQEVVP